MISGFGFQEFLLIAVIVLIIFGPKRLPELMRVMGRVTREIRKIAWDFRSALDLESLEEDMNTTIRKQNQMDTEVEDDSEPDGKE